MWFTCAKCGRHVCEEVQTQAGAYICRRCKTKPMTFTNMKGIFGGKPPIFIFSLLLFAGSAVAQECPQNLVCISREAAIQAVENADKVKALEAEGKVKDQAIADQKEVISKLKIEYAEKVGENIALKQAEVSNRAIIELLLKSTKRKCLPFSVCIGS